MLDEKDMELLKATFVSRDACQSAQAEQAEKLAKESARSSVIEAQLSTITKILYILATAAIGGLVAAIFNMILR